MTRQPLVGLASSRVPDAPRVAWSVVDERGEELAYGDAHDDPSALLEDVLASGALDGVKVSCVGCDLTLDLRHRGAGLVPADGLAGRAVGAALAIARVRRWDLDDASDVVHRAPIIAADGSFRTANRRLDPDERALGVWAWYAGPGCAAQGVCEGATGANEMELWALVEALRTCDDDVAPLVVTDSSNALERTVRDPWARSHPDARLDDLGALVRAEIERTDARLRLIRGHSGHPLHERADRRAYTLGRDVTRLARLERRGIVRPTPLTAGSPISRSLG